MIDRVGIQRKRAHGLQGAQGGCLAAPASACNSHQRHAPAKAVPDLLLRQRPAAHKPVGRRAHVHDCGLLSQTARAPVQHGGDFSVKVAQDLRGCFGAGRAAGVGGGGRQGEPRLPQQRKGQRVVRAAQAQGVSAGAHQRALPAPGAQHQCQRTRPEPLRQRQRAGGHRVAVFRDGLLPCHQHAQGLGLRPPLDRVNPFHRPGVQRISRQSVHGLRRDRGQLALPQVCSGSGYIAGYDLSFHFPPLSLARTLR